MQPYQNFPPRALFSTGRKLRPPGIVIEATDPEPLTTAASMTAERTHGRGDGCGTASLASTNVALSPACWRNDRVSDL